MFQHPQLKHTERWCCRMPCRSHANKSSDNLCSSESSDDDKQ
nr:MAG TPA: hypothetical protein [Caudoviricetes sp.]